jgi:hypothetical protein
MADGQGISRGRTFAAVAAAVVIAIAVLAFFLRDYAIETIAESYFAANGAKSDVAIDSWDSAGLHLHLALGADREFTAQQVTITFDPHFWLPHVDSVTVRGTRLAVGFDGHRISFGSLQPLIDSFRKPKAKSWTDDYIRAPLPVTIEDARLVVKTPAGVVTMAARAALSGSQVVSAAVHASPALLTIRGQDLHLDSGSLAAGWSGGGLDVGGNASLSAHGRVPTSLRATLNAPHVSWANGTYTAQVVTLDAVAVGAFGAVATDYASLHAQATDLRAKMSGDFNANAKFNVSFSSGNGVVNGTQILPAHLTLEGQAGFANNVASLAARVRGDGGLSVAATRSALAPLPGFSTAPELVDAVARAASAFHAATAIEARSDAAEQTIRLTDPIKVTSASGASATLAQQGGSASWLSFRDGRVGANGALAIGGGGLPAVKLSVDNLSVVHGARAYNANAALHTTLAISTRAFRNVSIAADAHIASDDNALALTLDKCAAVQVGAWVVKNKNELADIVGAMCADAGKPLFLQNAEGWQFGAALQRVSAKFPDAGAEMGGGAGHIALAGDRTGMSSGTLALNESVLSDRVNKKIAPLRATGSAQYRKGRWAGRVVVQTTLHKTSIATIDTVYDVASGKARASIAAPDIKFAPKGLAASDISPLLAMLANADGHASFRGEIDWTKSKITSGGTLDTEGLQFASPMGAASDTATHIRFISLLPPETAPNQAFAIGRIDWLSPIKTVAGNFHMKPQVIEIGGIAANVAGGSLKIDPLTITLGAKEAISAGIKLSQIDLGQLLADSNLASKVHLDAVASGSIPISISGAGVHITNGVIASTRPGRISIDRSLWARGAVSSNAMQDFAYQALENLAFDSLRGELNSQPNGRLEIVLHIQGHSDPPNAQEARIGLFDLVRGDAFNKAIPLPKGTPIDLTLDTSLNFDELLRAYQAARSPTISAP